MNRRLTVCVLTVAAVVTAGQGWAKTLIGDFNGDGKADLAVYHEATGNWFIQKLNGTTLGYAVNWGFPGAIAVPGDFDGDGKADLAVYHEATGLWYIRTLAGPVLVLGQSWGFPGARPVPGDFDGDGKADLAVYCEANGKWYVRTLSGTVLVSDRNWGFPGAVAVGRVGEATAQPQALANVTGTWKEELGLLNYSYIFYANGTWEEWYGNESSPFATGTYTVSGLTVTGSGTHYDGPMWFTAVISRVQPADTHMVLTATGGDYDPWTGWLLYRQ